MYKLLIAIAVVLPTAASAEALEPRDAVHVAPPAVPHPLPQGIPYATAGVSHGPAITLRYGVIDGRRVLLEPVSGQVVYVLQP